MSRSAVNPIPEGFHSLTPYLVCKGAAEAIDFYGKAFGAQEQFRLPGPGGKILHACLRIGDSPLMLNDEFPDMCAFSPKHLGGTPVTIHLSVPDVDAVVARALAAGAKLVMPVADMFWGARYGLLQDPFGHSWSVATQIENLSPQQIKANLDTSMCGGSSGATREMANESRTPEVSIFS